MTNTEMRTALLTLYIAMKNPPPAVPEVQTSSCNVRNCTCCNQRTAQ